MSTHQSFFYMCISLRDTVVTESANHIKIMLRFELSLNEKCIKTLKTMCYGYGILFQLKHQLSLNPNLESHNYKQTCT